MSTETLWGFPVKVVDGIPGVPENPDMVFGDLLADRVIEITEGQSLEFADGTVITGPRMVIITYVPEDVRQ